MLTEHTLLKEEFIFSGISLNPGDYLVLEIKDTGHGMDWTTLERIFDPYFTTKEIGEGTGLGLSVVHGIVKSYGGEIWVNSELDKGTSMKVYFPKIFQEPHEKADPSEEVLQTGNERILVVEDDQNILRLLVQSLSLLEYQVSAFLNSQEALTAFSTNPDGFDLVITDMTMPKMTGIELSEKILIIRPDVPIILCTGYSEFATPQKASEIGIKGFLYKPVFRGELSKTIREVLDAAKMILKKVE